MQDVLERLTAAVDEVLAASPSGLADAEVLHALDTLEVQTRRLAAASVQVVAEVQSRRGSGAYGSSAAADLLVTRLRVTPAEARERCARADDLAPRTTLAGEPLPPLLPEVADGLRAGALSAGHARVISDVLDRVPSWLDATAVATVEHLLVEAARHEDPAAVRRTGALLLARLEPDDPPEPDATRRDRSFGLRRHGDGTSTPTGRWNVELTALITTVLDALSAPAPSGDGLPDTRTAGQRRHDALMDVLARVLRPATCRRPAASR